MTSNFRGTWSVEGTGDSLQRWLHASNGSVFVALTSRPTSTSGVADVAGELVLTTAEVGFNTRGEALRLGIDGGVYVAEAGQLRLRLSSRLVADVTAADAAAIAPVYRGALRDAAHDLLNRGGNGRMMFSGRNASAEGRAPSGLRRRCSFQLEAHATTVAHPEQDWSGVPSIHIDGHLVSPCGIHVNLHAVEMHSAQMLAKAQTVGMLSGMLALVMISLTARQLDSSASPAALQRISFGCICHQGMLDSATCVFHLMAGIVADELLSTYIFVALAYFSLFTFLEMRLLTGIWRASLPNGGTLAELRDSMRNLHSRFYGAMLLCAFVVITLRQHITFLLLGLHSFWVWQVVHTAVRDMSRPLSMRYVLGMSACRVALPSYFFGCPRNWARVKTSNASVFALIAWVLAQAGMMYSQHIWGARWFLPVRFRPPRFDYHRPATPAEQASFGWNDPVNGERDAESLGNDMDMVDCPVCQLELPREQPGERPTGRMVTPCGHFFHTECLQQWLEVKLECPTCRGILPLP